MYSESIGTVVLKMEDGKRILLEKTLLVPQLGCNLVSARKLCSSNIQGVFNPTQMIFFRVSDNVTLVKAETRNGLYIISEIAKEANGMSFKSVTQIGATAKTLLKPPQNPPLLDNSLKAEVTKYHRIASKIAYSSAKELAQSVKKDQAEFEALPTKLQYGEDPWQLITKKTSKEKSFSSTTSTPLKSNNIFNNLDDEHSSSEEDEPQIAEIERGADKSLNPPYVSKREKNAVYRKVRKEGRDKLPDPTTFALKERRERREMERYVHYHRRFGHANPKALSLLHTVCEIKKIVIPEKLPICQVCDRQKMRKQRSKVLATHKQQPLALVSFDVAGPFPTSYRGYKYFGMIVDSWSRKTWTLLFKTREEILPALKLWKKKVELFSSYKLLATMTDNAPEILETLREFEEQDGVTVGTTEAYTSRQNGTAERSIQFTENNIRAMIDDSGLPVEFWCEAAVYQSHFRNRMRRGPDVTEAIVTEDGKNERVEYRLSPEEAFTGKEIKIRDIIKTWGCKVVASIDRKSIPGRADKLMPVGREGIFMGCNENTNALHRIYAPDMHTTITSSSVKFYEDIPGGSIENFQLWCETSEGNFEQREGDYSHLPVRRKRGRPMGWRRDGSHNQPTARESTSGGEVGTEPSPAPAEENQANTPEGETQIVLHHPFTSPAFRDLVPDSLAEAQPTPPMSPITEAANPEVATNPVRALPQELANQTPPKKKRGRPPGSTNKPKDPTKFTIPGPKHHRDGEPVEVSIKPAPSSSAEKRTNDDTPLASQDRKRRAPPGEGVSRVNIDDVDNLPKYFGKKASNSKD